jgi:hypothetical protein
VGREHKEEGGEVRPDPDIGDDGEKHETTRSGKLFVSFQKQNSHYTIVYYPQSLCMKKGETL